MQDALAIDEIDNIVPEGKLRNRCFDVVQVGVLLLNAIGVLGDYRKVDTDRFRVARQIGDRLDVSASATSGVKDDFAVGLRQQMREQTPGDAAIVEVVCQSVRLEVAFGLELPLHHEVALGRTDIVPGKVGHAMLDRPLFRTRSAFESTLGDHVVVSRVELEITFADWAAEEVHQAFFHLSPFETTHLPTTMWSSPVETKTPNASCSLLTIGLPMTFKDVFKRMGTPVSFLNSVNSW